MLLIRSIMRLSIGYLGCVRWTERQCDYYFTRNEEELIQLQCKAAFEYL